MLEVQAAGLTEYFSSVNEERAFNTE